LKTTPTLLNFLRNVPSHSGQDVRLLSENDWTMSKAWPQSLQA
jgi:hypothetical protein